jgi:hypothetical protein
MFKERDSSRSLACEVPRSLWGEVPGRREWGAELKGRHTALS